jgi:hypothetical protein
MSGIKSTLKELKNLSKFVLIPLTEEEIWVLVTRLNTCQLPCPLELEQGAL